MYTTLAHMFVPVLGDYVYIGGGAVTLIVIILVVLFVARRA
jgi:hypothetical protein